MVTLKTLYVLWGRGELLIDTRRETIVVYVVVFRRRGVPIIGQNKKKKNTKESRKIKKIITIPVLWVTARNPRDVFAGRKTVPAREPINLVRSMKT